MCLWPWEQLLEGVKSVRQAHIAISSDLRSAEQLQHTAQLTQESSEALSRQVRAQQQAACAL